VEEVSLRRRRSGDRERWGEGRQASQRHGEGRCGVGLAWGRPEEGSPQQARRGRRPWRAAALGCIGASSLRLGDGKGVEREVGNVCCSSERERRGARMQVGRLSMSSSWRFERPSSVCAQGDGAAWRGRETLGRNQGRGRRFWPGARHVAGQSSTPAHGAVTARNKEEGGEMVVRAIS
jgi:hypothetical protein